MKISDNTAEAMLNRNI